MWLVLEQDRLCSIISLLVTTTRTSLVAPPQSRSDVSFSSVLLPTLLAASLPLLHHDACEQISEDSTKGSKATLVYGQMNEPPGARARVALTGLTIAEVCYE